MPKTPIHHDQIWAIGTLESSYSTANRPTSHSDLKDHLIECGNCVSRRKCWNNSNLSPEVPRHCRMCENHLCLGARISNLSSQIDILVRTTSTSTACQPSSEYVNVGSPTKSTYANLHKQQHNKLFHPRKRFG